MCIMALRGLLQRGRQKKHMGHLLHENKSPFKGSGGLRQKGRRQNSPPPLNVRLSHLSGRARRARFPP